MKCKFCNTELQEGQVFCNQCGNKVEVDLNEVDKTTIDSNGVMTYDFDFSDQVVSNAPKKDELVVQNVEPAVQNVEPAVQKEQPEVQNVEPAVQNEQLEVQNVEPAVQKEQPEIQNVETNVQANLNVGSTMQATTPVEPINNPNEVPTVDAKNNNISVLDEKDLNRKYNLMPIYIIGVVLLIISGYFFYQNVIAYKPAENSQGNNNENNQEIIEDTKDDTEEEENKEENKEENSEENKEENKVEVQTTEVSFSGLILKIPNNLLYTFEGEYLVIYAQDKSWSTVIGVNPGSFYNMKTNKDLAKSLLEAEGVTVHKSNLTYYGGTEWLNFEVELQGEKSIIGYADAPKENCFAVVVSTPDNTFNYTAFKAIAPIIQTAR